MNDLVRNSDVLPLGQNFRTSSGISPDDLCTDAARIINFLNTKSASGLFFKFADWLQHDGLLFEDGTARFNELMQLIENSEHLEESMPGDTYVRIGLLSEDRSCYFRIFSNTEDLDNPFRAEYDLTLDRQIMIDFEKTVVPHLKAVLMRENSPDYYKRISKQ